MLLNTNTFILGKLSIDFIVCKIFQYCFQTVKVPLKSKWVPCCSRHQNILEKPFSFYSILPCDHSYRRHGLSVMFPVHLMGNCFPAVSSHNEWLEINNEKKGQIFSAS